MIQSIAECCGPGGLIAGAAQLKDNWYAVVWDDAKPVLLGSDKVYYSSAEAMNSHGKIVGSIGDKCFLWRKADGWKKTEVTASELSWIQPQAINDSGRIVAWCLYKGKGGLFLLTPK